MLEPAGIGDIASINTVMVRILAHVEDLTSRINALEDQIKEMKEIIEKK